MLGACGLSQTILAVAAVARPRWQPVSAKLAEGAGAAGKMDATEVCACWWHTVRASASLVRQQPSFRDCCEDSSKGPDGRCARPNSAQGV